MIQKLMLFFFITLTSYAAPKVGDYVTYQVSNHYYHDYPESFTIKLEVASYDFISDSMKLSVKVESANGTVPCSDHWMSPSLFDKQKNLDQMASKCSKGQKENVRMLNGAVMPACKFDLIESAMSGAINPTSYIKFDYDNAWVTKDIPITGMARVMGKLWGAMVISYGSKTKLPILEHISDRQYFCNDSQKPSH